MRRHPVRGDVHHVALGHEHPLDQRRHLRFVFDNEDSHRAALCGRPGRRSRAGGPLWNSHPGLTAGWVDSARQWGRTSHTTPGAPIHDPPHRPLRRIAGRAGRRWPPASRSPASPRRCPRRGAARAAPRRRHDRRAGPDESRSTPSTSPRRPRPRTSSSPGPSQRHDGHGDDDENEGGRLMTDPRPARPMPRPDARPARPALRVRPARRAAAAAAAPSPTRTRCG